jgi:hypothetical protein
MYVPKAWSQASWLVHAGRGGEHGRFPQSREVSTAAFHKVEECETNPARAFEVNGTGAMNLAVACQRSGAVLANFSTDYVFDGKKKAAYEKNSLTPVSAP